MTRTLALALFVTACVTGCGGSGSNNNGGGTPDAQVFLDAPPVVPTTLTITGTAKENTQSGSVPFAGVSVSLFKTTDDTTALATATSAADGTYTLTVQTDGHVIDGFLRGSKTGYIDNDSFPAGPFQGNTTGADVNLISTSNFSFLKLLGGGHDGKGLIIVEILDASSAPVAGATVSSNPAAGGYKYSDSNGTPTATMSTAADGAAFVFDLPPGTVQVSASKTGATFKSHSIVVKADHFTTTVVTE
jgi:hypothetical protein